MLTSIHPKLPMRNKAVTKDYYLNELGFEEFGNEDYEDYIMIQKENIEIHFFLFRELNPKENYGQVYIRVANIDKIYRDFLDDGVSIHPNASLQIKPWGMKEFSLLDPDNNLLTFGESLL